MSRTGFDIVVVLGVSTLWACAPADAPPPPGTKDLRIEIPAGPEAAEGFQIVSPDFVIPKGKDVMLCWVPEVTFDEDRVMSKFDTLQSQNGHHLFGMKSRIPRRPGEQFDCTNTDDMSTVEPLITPTSGGQEGTVNLLPDGMSVRIRAGTQLVMQSHYVNTTDEDILVRDVGVFRYLPAGEETIEANYLVLNDESFDIPPTNTLYTHSAECTLNTRFQFAAMNGHMHEWGKRTYIEHIAPDDTATIIYDEPRWTAAFRDAPPIVRWPTDDPMVFEAGDRLRVTCDWVNDTEEALRFPNEMCVTLLVYFPALPEGFVLCE